jgi:hypothetical protein
LFSARMAYVHHSALTLTLPQTRVRIARALTGSRMAGHAL